MTVSVMLRCSLQAVSSSSLDLLQSLEEVQEGERTPVPNQPSDSGETKERYSYIYTYIYTHTNIHLYIYIY